MKPATVAKKLGIYLPATPQEFQDSVITRADFAELQANPPEWLAELRRNGPHPRPVVAQKLNVSIAGLARGGVEEALTTAVSSGVWGASSGADTCSQYRPERRRGPPRRLPRAVQMLVWCWSGLVLVPFWFWSDAVLVVVW